MSDADQMRAKRLARLQAAESEQPRRTASSSSSISIDHSAGSSSPSSARSIKPVQASASTSAVPHSTNQEVVAMKMSRMGSSGANAHRIPLKSPKPAPKTVEFETWAINVLERIFWVYITPDPPPTPGFMELPSIQQELEDPSNIPGLLQAGLIDQVAVERLRCNTQDILFDYLRECFKRSMRERTLIPRSVRGTAREKLFVSFLDEAESLCISYAGIVLQQPDIFPQPHHERYGPGYMFHQLVREASMMSGNMSVMSDEIEELFPKEFLIQFAARFQGEGLDTMLEDMQRTLFRMMRGKDLLDDWRPCLEAVQKLSSVRVIATMLPSCGKWCFDDVPAQEIEHKWLLGPFMRLGTLPEKDSKLAEKLFGDQFRRTQANVESATGSLRLSLSNLYKGVFDILFRIVKSSPEGRLGVLTCFQSILNANEKWAQMQVDREVVSSDTFMINLAVILLHFAGPIEMGKEHMISKSYFVNPRRRVSLTGETSLVSTEKEVENYRKNRMEVDSGGSDQQSPPNFVSDITYLTLRALHLGLVRIMETYRSFLRHMSDMRTQYERVSQQQENMPSGPGASGIAALLAAHVERTRKELDAHVVQKLASDAQLMDPQILSRAFAFLNVAMSWMISVILGIKEPRGVDTKSIKLPQNMEPAMEWQILPEYFVRNVSEFFEFIERYKPSILTTQSLDPLIGFIVVILQHPQHVKNPYLRAKIAEILVAFTFEFRGQPAGGLFSRLESHPLAREYLFPALMRLYIDVEQTGLSTQFYDKFNIRHNLQQVFKRIWEATSFREVVKTQCTSDMFVRFANLLINDTTYLLDEGLAKLTEIHSLEIEMGNKEEYERRSEQYRQGKERQLRQAERQAQSYMALGNDTVDMLRYLTGAAPTPFLTPEIVGRLAAMLDYNLNVLVGPKCTSLTVKDPSMYYFKPKALLSDLVQVYLNLAEYKEFTDAVAKDGRSYSKGNFKKAASVMVRYSLKSPDSINTLKKFVHRVEETIESERTEAEEMGEVPEHFLDPLMYTIMEHPVILPSSGVTVDLSTIKSHLLSDEHDPFNRSPLTLENLITNHELKQEIEDFRRKARKGRDKHKS